MAKKSFTDNPAEQFISSIHVEKEGSQTESITENIAESPQRHALENAQKSHRENIEKNAPSPVNVIDHFRLQVPEGYKLDPRFIEKRTKRVNLLMQPSLYEKIQAKANQEKKSVNDFIHSYMEELLTK